MITRGVQDSSDGRYVCNENYLSFISKCIKFGKEHKNQGYDILVLDNRKATIPGIFLRKILHPRFTIQDCRELYLSREIKYLTGKIGCYFEKYMVKKADIVICANSERAQLMQEEYKLKNTPLTYENLRKLEYSSEEGFNKAKKKLSEYVSDDEIRLLTSSGCSVKRTNDVLVENLKKVNRKCHLLLVGNSTDKDKEVIISLAKKDRVNKFTILGQLNQDELKYLISQCHIGIVNYGQYDTNNKMCASGKLYEFLYEGIPVVTTTNPPLKRLCDKEKIGVADDMYYKGINYILDNYDTYLCAAKEFTKNNTIESNDKKLIAEIMNIIKGSNK